MKLMRAATLVKYETHQVLIGPPIDLWLSGEEV